MAARNTTVQQPTEDRLISIKAAMDLLGITSAGAFAAAVKSHDFLKAGIVPATDEFKRRIHLSAVNQYIETRGEHGGSRDGAKWFTVRLSNDEAERLMAVASDLFGREVEFVQPSKRVKAVKAETNGVEVEADETDEDSDDETEE